MFIPTVLALPAEPFQPPIEVLAGSDVNRKLIPIIDATSGVRSPKSIEFRFFQKSFGRIEEIQPGCEFSNSLKVVIEEPNVLRLLDPADCLNPQLKGQLCLFQCCHSGWFGVRANDDNPACRCAGIWFDDSEFSRLCGISRIPTDVLILCADLIVNQGELVLHTSDFELVLNRSLAQSDTLVPIASHTSSRRLPSDTIPSSSPAHQSDEAGLGFPIPVCRLDDPIQFNENLTYDAPSQSDTDPFCGDCCGFYSTRSDEDDPQD